MSEHKHSWLDAYNAHGEREVFCTKCSMSFPTPSRRWKMLSYIGLGSFLRWLDKRAADKAAPAMDNYLSRAGEKKWPAR